MTGAEWFIAGVAALQLGASVLYIAQGKWADAVVWLGVVASNVAWIVKVTR